MCISGYFYLRTQDGNYLGAQDNGHSLEIFEAQKSNCRFWEPPLFSWDGEYLVYEGRGNGRKRVLTVERKIFSTTLHDSYKQLLLIVKLWPKLNYKMS